MFVHTYVRMHTDLYSSHTPHIPPHHTPLSHTHTQLTPHHTPLSLSHTRIAHSVAKVSETTEATSTTGDSDNKRGGVGRREVGRGGGLEGKQGKETRRIHANLYTLEF